MAKKKKSKKLDMEGVKEEKKEEKPKNGRIAIIDINLDYRKGDFVPQEQIDRWVKDNGIDINPFFGED